jgi:hypothetical protein
MAFESFEQIKEISSSLECHKNVKTLSPNHLKIQRNHRITKTRDREDYFQEN